MFQVRSEETGMREFETLDQAFEYAAEDETVWKISFNVVTDERVRLVKFITADEEVCWLYEPILPSDFLKSLHQD